VLGWLEEEGGMSLRGVAPQDPSHRLRQHCSEMWCSKTRLLRKRVCGIRFKSPGQAVMEEVESRAEKQIRPDDQLKSQALTPGAIKPLRG
jgi:hypothetical protein